MENQFENNSEKQKKFYFFDNGVARVLSGTIDHPLADKTFEYGQFFENFIVNEIYRLLHYSEQSFRLSFLRVSENQEIDLIIEKGPQEIFLCEIKSTTRVDERHARSLKSLGKDFHNPKQRLISRDPQTKKFGETLALPWEKAIEEICV